MSTEHSIQSMPPQEFTCTECKTECRIFCEHPQGMSFGGTWPQTVRHCERGQIEQIAGNAKILEEKRDGKWIVVRTW